jgi:hypothetical protein
MGIPSVEEEVIMGTKQTRLIVTGEIPAQTIVTADLADLAVTTAKIANTNVTTAKIALLGVTEGTIAAGAVTETKVGVGAATQERIYPKTYANIADGAVVLTVNQFLVESCHSMTTTVPRNLTTPTATDVIAAMTNPQIGSWGIYTMAELGGNAWTLVAGADFTLVGAAAVNATGGSFVWVVTNVAAPAITITRAM